MTRNIALDNPAERPEDDEFNRWPFSQRLADTIAAFDTSQGAPVLGLFGRWGYGKSTVLNFVRLALERDHGERVTVFTFNPWLFKDQDALLREFFAGLARNIDAQFEKTGKRVGELMQRYGGALSSVPWVGNSLSKTAEAIGKGLSEDPTSAQRHRLIDMMRESPKKVVALIDDIDRLDRDEIMTVLKMVRLSANFPNVVYLLAFDEERVGRVAGLAYGEEADGRQFLEKIIQHPFSLPAVGSDRLASYVMRHARAACDEAKIVLSDKNWTEFHRICKETFLVQLGTPRQAIRYANALRFALPMLKGEVDPFDQLIVEAMRILFPTLYGYVRDNLNFKDMKFSKMSANEKEAAGPLIKVLLRRERELDKSVSDPRYHARYFSYAVTPDDVSDAELKFLLDLCEKGDQANVNLNLRVLAEKRLGVLIRRLSPLVDKLPSDTAQSLALALALTGDVLPAGLPLCDHPIASDMAHLIAWFARRVWSVQDKRGKSTATQIITCATPLPFALKIHEELALSVAFELEPEHREIRRDWKRLGSILCERIKADVLSRPPYDHYSLPDALRLLRFWHDNASDEQRIWLESRLKDHPTEAIKFLAMFGDKLVNYEFIAKFADPTIIAQAVESCLGLPNVDRDSQKLSEAHDFVRAHNQQSAREKSSTKLPTSS